MSKVAVITDSNSGITQEQGKALGITVLPMPFMFDEVEFFEDINLTQDGFYEKLEGNCKVSTSQPSPEAVMNAWDEALKTHDEVVYIPMSSGLSSSYRTALMLSEDYEDKVEVINNQRISVTQRQSVLDAIKLANDGLSAKEIREKLEDDKFNSSIYISLDTLEYLKKGGRLTPAVAMLGQLLKIKPVLQIQGEKLDAFAKVRTLSQAKHCMLTQMEKDVTERFGCPASGKGMHIMVAHTRIPAEAEIFLNEIKERFPEADFYCDNLSLSVSCHIGPGALAIACSKVM
ncbi:MAG: DegV family protein [Lachnospiraceae bacterium]|nr:DegV family protein [Lachnospiraceae bacterium]